MIIELLAAMALAAGSASGTLSSCNSEFDKAWPAISAGLDEAAKADAAIAALGPVEQACRDEAEMRPFLSGVAAELNLQRGRPEGAVARLTTTPTPEGHGLWSANQWTLLSAYEVLGDKAGFVLARDTLLAGHDRAVVAGMDGMRKVERFETPLAVVDAYEGRIVNGAYVRVQVFVAAPKNGGMPATMTVALDPGTHEATSQRYERGRGSRYVVDFYPCERPVSLDVVAGGPNGDPPPYAQMRKKAVALFSSADNLPPMKAPKAHRHCVYPRYMLPGFTKGVGEED